MAHASVRVSGANTIFTLQLRLFTVTQWYWRPDSAMRVSCVRAPRARHTHCRTRRHPVDRSSSFQMPSASAKSPHVKTTIVSCIAHNRLQSFRVAHSSSSRSTNVTARRQHAFRLPSASTPPDTRSESKTSIAAHAQASCCSHLAERCWFAQTKAAASAQHVDGTTPLLDSGLERTQSESRIEQRQPSCDMRGQQPRLRSVFATILAIANTPTVSSCNTSGQHFA